MSLNRLRRCPVASDSFKTSSGVDGLQPTDQKWNRVFNSGLGHKTYRALLCSLAKRASLELKSCPSRRLSLSISPAFGVTVNFTSLVQCQNTSGRRNMRRHDTQLNDTHHSNKNGDTWYNISALMSVIILKYTVLWSILSTHIEFFT